MNLLNFPIVPILVIEDASWAKDLGYCLVESGFPLLEVTLRTPQSWQAIEAIAELGVIELGIGSVSSVDELKRAKELNLKFAVSPGISRRLVESSREYEISYLPGVATPSEMLLAMELDISILKWFPAESLGGIRALRSFSAPFPNLKFIPTGGITEELADDYLKEANVRAIGGSWMFPKDLMEKRDLASLEEIFRATTKRAQI
jgi:2-dehydro-3-deoxyphosphogluconate aldolase/(4S)-4-hydroxy-2-oxoglutarate aldolase